MRARAAFLMIASLAACDRQQAPPPVADNAAVVAPDAQPAARSAGCATAWEVAIDPESFANNGADKTFTAARLAMFRDQLQNAVRGAVDAACAAGEVDAAEAKAVKRVTAFSASGASEPTFFGGDDAGSLRLEWVFAEQDLTVPSEMELRGGLVCWTDPESDLCAEREP